MLVLIPTVSLLAACSNSNNKDDNDKQMAKDAIDIANLGTQEQREQAKEFVDAVDTNLSLWPASKLPIDLPEYPGGEMYVVLNEGNLTVVNIQGTTPDTVKEYIETLRTAGWEIVEDSVAGILFYSATKDGWKLGIQQSRSTAVAISITPSK